MFVQVIQGRTRDREGLREMLDRWSRELKPGAAGYLGSTGGVTADGEVIMAVRFESEEAARRNGERPEQGAWWSETEKLFDGPVDFYDCTEIDEFLGGGSDDAGFVQVMQGYVTDKATVRDLMGRMQEVLPDHRPDVLGGYCAWGPEDGFSQLIYFTSESAAREGESKPLPEELGAWRDSWEKAVTHLKFLDLTDPWIESA